jgi:hypothetical protein
MGAIATIVRAFVAQCFCIMWLVAFAATSCIHSQNYEIPIENRPVFHTGERFVYKALNTGETDTVEVSLEIEKFKYHKDDYSEGIRIEYTLLENNIPTVSLITVTQEIESLKILNNTGYMQSDTLYKDYTLSNRNVIHAVHRFISSKPLPVVSELCYHYRYGIVKYVYKGQTLEIEAHR